MSVESDIIDKLEAALLDTPPLTREPDDKTGEDKTGSEGEIKQEEIDHHPEVQLDDISISRLLKNIDDRGAGSDGDSASDVHGEDTASAPEPQTDIAPQSESDQPDTHTSKEAIPSFETGAAKEERDSNNDSPKFGFGLVRKLFAKYYKLPKDNEAEALGHGEIPDILNSKPAEFAMIAMKAHCSHIAKFLMPEIYSDLLNQYKSGESFAFPRAILSLEHSLVQKLLSEAWNTNSQIRLSTLGYYKEFAKIIKISVDADPDSKSDILKFWARSDYGKLYWLLYSAQPA